jgi:hypothetical protein
MVEDVEEFKCRESTEGRDVSDFILTIFHEVGCEVAAS